MRQEQCPRAEGAPLEEVVGVAAAEAGDAEADVEGDGGREPAHQRAEPAGGDQVARHVNPSVAAPLLLKDGCNFA